MKIKKSICLIFLATSSVMATPFDNLIVFGDSLSDAASWSTNLNQASHKSMGNNYWIPVEGTTGAPITSQDKQTQQQTLWPNYLVQNTTLFSENPNQTRLIYPSSQMDFFGFSPLRYNIDYAWASAETGRRYLNDMDSKKIDQGYYYADESCQITGAGKIDATHACVPGVLTQVQTYLKAVNYKPNPRSLIILWAGANDIFNNVIRIKEANQHDNKLILLAKLLLAAYPSNYIPSTEPLSSPVKNIKQAVELLIIAGVPAQNIYVISLPDLSRTPIAIRNTQGEKILLYTFSIICDIFNIALHMELSFNYLHAQYNLPNGNIISADSLFDAILKNEPQEGLIHHLEDCVLNHAEPYCEGYIFFNNKHPTTKVHSMISEYIAKTLSQRVTN